MPARNTLFVAYALAAAEVWGAEEIVLGVNVLDASGYPDCRPEWLAAMQEVVRLGTRAGVEGRPIRLVAPLIEMTKAEIIRDRDARWASTTASPTPATTRRPDGARLRRLRRLPAAPARLRRPGCPTRPATLVPSRVGRSASADGPAARRAAYRTYPIAEQRSQRRIGSPRPQTGARRRR